MLCCAYIAYCCDCAPRLCFCLGIAAIFIPAYFLVMAVFFNPTEHFGVPNDYSGITSKYDLALGKIDHWCLKGDNESCRCEDPLEPQSRGEFRAWARAQAANTEYVKELIDAGKGTPEIAFLGGSVVEAMGGKWFGRDNDDNLKSLKRIFDTNFQKESGGALDAVSLGIAGDTNPTVLWRLQNGEMPEAFNPKIWWLEVGLNDLGRSQCSEEVVVLGILRIVEEILEKKKDAIVVINSLFPMADLRGGLKPGDNDFKDGFDKKLRTTPTVKIEKIEKKQEKKKNGGKKVNTNQADAGDTTHVAHQKEDDGKKKGTKKGDTKKKETKDPKKKETEAPKKKETEAPKKKETEAPKKKETEAPKKKEKGGEGRRVLELSADSRELRMGKTKDSKDIKMKANKESQKKFNIVTRRERKLPLWTIITAVNKELRRFADKNEKVFFFDSTGIFTEREDRDSFLLKTDMISVRGHPSLKGFKAWEEAIILEANSRLNLPKHGA